MLPEVEQDVGDRVADFARGGQRARMVAVAPHLPDARDALDGERDTDDEATNSGG